MTDLILRGYNVFYSDIFYRIISSTQNKTAKPIALEMVLTNSNEDFSTTDVFIPVSGKYIFDPTLGLVSAMLVHPYKLQ